MKYSVCCARQAVHVLQCVCTVHIAIKLVTKVMSDKMPSHYTRGQCKHYDI